MYSIVEALILAAGWAVVLFAGASLARRLGLWAALARSGAAGLWLLVVWELARAGLFEGRRAGAPLLLLACAAGPLMAGLAGLWWRRAPDAWSGVGDLVAIQSYRVVGTVVLLAWAAEALPAWLALPIGLGELVVGGSAWWVAAALRRLEPGALGLARGWTAVGSLSAVFVIVAPAAASRTAGYFLTLYPLVLLPAFLGPAALWLHAAAARRWRWPYGLRVSSPPGSVS